MRILHITNWYPSIPTPNAAPWIKSQIEGLPEVISNTVYHIEVKKGFPQIRGGENKDGTYYLIIYFPLLIWRIVEWISHRMVLWVLKREKLDDYDLVNFHIAYPNLTYIDKIKKKVGKPILINEHWSAYHCNFNVGRPEKLHRIKGIFKHGIPLAAVSKALIEDIKKFSSTDFPSSVVPNVVDINIFNFDRGVRRQPNTFFMVSQWKWPKDPFGVLKVWPEVVKDNPKAMLRVGGYGPQWGEMKLVVKNKNIENVEFLGKLSSDQVAEEMKMAGAFIHFSGYETFSVVCAEALCCGTPVIASNVGGITEFVNRNNGVLLTKNTPEAIEDTVSGYKLRQYNHEEISKEACSRFSAQHVGKLYMQVIKGTIETEG